MNRNRLAILIFLLYISLPRLYAQSWRSKLYPDSWNPEAGQSFYSGMLIQDFSFAGYHNGVKEIPSGFPITINVTKAPYNADNTGKQDVTSAIQRAIDDAAQISGGAVVFLPAGTYQVSPQAEKDYCLLISHADIIIRGEGMGRTFLLNVSTAMRSKTILKVSSGASWRKSGRDKRSITKDLMSPDVIVPVEDVKGYKAGDLIIVRNYIDNDWIGKHNMLPYWKDRGESLGGLIYFRKVVSVNEERNELIIDIPVRYALEKVHHSCVYKAPPMLSEVGVEKLSVGNVQSFEEGDWSEESFTRAGSPSYSSHDSWAIAMEGLYNGWIKEVSSFCPKGNTSGAHLLSNGVKLSQTANVTVVSCDFRKPQFGGGGGNGYMYRIMGNENLIENCRSDFSRHGFVLSGMNASGNVFFRCYDKDSGMQTGLSGREKTSGSGSDHHMHFSHSNLFDQCTVENSFFAAGWRKWGGSAIHGLTAAHSVYWNLTSSGSQDYAVQTQQGRYGYVIGTSGNKPRVRTDAWQAGTETITDPVDYTEGIGTGRTLVPQSLYLDQKTRRAARKH